LKKDEKEIYKNLAKRFEEIAKQPTYQKNSTKNNLKSYSS